MIPTSFLYDWEIIPLFVGAGLPVKARLGRANNQRGMDNPPLIKALLYPANFLIFHSIGPLENFFLHKTLNKYTENEKSSSK